MPIKWGDMTPEQQDRKRAYAREYRAKQRASWTPEEREQALAKRRVWGNAYTTRQAQRRSELPLDELETLRAYNRDKQAERRARFSEADRELRREWGRRYHVELRLLVLKFYGGDPPSCACCGEGRLQFLAIDHINGGGNAHRRSISPTNSTGKSVYQWLKKNGFPEGYRVLCHNCNFARGHYGGCPHDDERVVPLMQQEGATL